ncbi:metal ABC transporter substrate-binding protein [Thermoflavimicrobium daqui]|jgi:zinc transport system substrate-binding protein|uniref:Zinc ABC transporter substrate-binding protein n=1 Tax=Thermoflavimicrobium daqui TaxID=2137476 RepID=A0A364K3M1_9BACL|nr:metal ABC transporter substrate-binding protein [Thermoflavimicrobium daqui]RAL23445.1 zinc ABC transporter substrate-binding protein [Thermoflavimicrobium daqui]
MSSRVRNIFVLFLIALFSLTGCGTSNPSASKSNGKLKVYVSLYPLEDFAKKIGGEYVQVTNLVPPGVEPHDFELTAKDIAKLHEANVFIYQGAGFENIKKVSESLNKGKTVVIDAATGIPLLKGTEAHGHDHDHAEHDHHHDSVDPHIWLDPQYAKKEAQNIRDAFIKADQKHRAEYEKNYQELAKKLDQLDQEYREITKLAKQKKFVTSHAAFGYLAKRYELTQIPITGISPTQEPSPQELKEIIETIQHHQVKYILFETLVTGKVAETVQREVKAESLTLNPLEGLTREEIAQKADYFSVMRKNKENLAKALEVQP